MHPIVAPAEAVNVMVSEAGPVTGVGYVTTSLLPPKTPTQLPHRTEFAKGGCCTTQPAGSWMVSEVTTPQP